MSIDQWVGLIFVILGIVMLVAELGSPGFFIAVPGTVLIVLGIIGLAWEGFITTWWSPLVAILVGAPILIVSMKLYQKLAPPAPPETTVGASLIGRQGLVVKLVEPDNIRGKVRIGSEVWSATSSVPIHTGKRVVVVESEGVHVTVRELKEGESVK